MLENLKRWFSGAKKSAVDAGTSEAVASWAEARQYSFRGVREDDGFVIDGRLGAAPWRLEWGPSQRSYVQGRELRLRAELGLGSEVQALLLDRPLQEQMEKAVFEQYVEGVQTRIDNQTPPEMRWLVMFPKLSGQDMGALRERFVAIASSKRFAMQWLQSPLADALAAAPFGPGKPLVLMISRGRLMLRTSLAEPDIGVLETWLRLFETAMREARRAGVDPSDSGAPSTQPSMWSASAMAPEAPEEQKA
jgi:hypothetical protein